MQYLQSDPYHFIAQGAIVCGDVELADGSSVWFHSVIRGDNGPIRIGERTNIQDCCVIHGSVSIGRNCTIGHSAVIHGCTIGDGTLIGMGSILLDGAVIGSNCMIGAGSLVTGKSRIPDGSLVMGSPARVIRELTEEEIRHLHQTADHYCSLTEQYR